MYSLARNKPWALVLLSGILLAAAFPPSPLGPLAFVAFVPLFVLLEHIEGMSEEVRKKGWLRRRWSCGYSRAFRYTYLTFLIWNILGCYWLTLTMIGAASFAEGLEYFMGGFLAITVNPLLMSLPWWVYMRMKRQLAPMQGGFALAALWVAFEFLHFRWDLSWSWLTIGHALTMYSPFIQHAEFTGVSGVSGHIMIANVLAFATYRQFAQGGKWKLRQLAPVLIWIALPLLLWPLIMIPSRKVFKSDGHYAVRIVQPSIDPYLKFEDMTRDAQYNLFYDLATAPGADTIDMVLLPETALTYPGGINENILRNDTLCRKLWSAVDQYQYSILTGLIERKIFTDPETAPPSATQVGSKYWDTYNAAVMMRPDQRVEFYEKIKLVPFVERMPFLNELDDLRKKGLDLTLGFGGYGKPDSLTLLHTHNNVPVGNLICYESEFTTVSMEHVRKGAELLVVMTNDGWWGKTSGYIQHAYLARLRAIETRRDIARSANTGRSLFVDARGRISHATDWWEVTHIDSRLHRHTAMTFYVRMGDWVGILALVASALAVVLAIAMRFIRRKNHQETTLGE